MNHEYGKLMHQMERQFKGRFAQYSHSIYVFMVLNILKVWAQSTKAPSHYASIERLYGTVGTHQFFSILIFSLRKSSIYGEKREFRTIIVIFDELAGYKSYI